MIIADAAEGLDTDRLVVTIENGWIVATPEASIVGVPCTITITPVGGTACVTG